MAYGCSKCGSTGSVMEIRRVIIGAGPGTELELAGIVPVQRCTNPQCGALSTPTTLKFGDVVNLVPGHAPSAEDQMREMREKIAAFEAAEARVADTCDDATRDSMDSPGGG